MDLTISYDSLVLKRVQPNGSKFNRYCSSEIIHIIATSEFAVSYHCKAYEDVHEGPLNITRTVGETYIVIPCPFSGAYEVTWNINGILYSMFNLPKFDGIKLLPVSSGLLIPLVTEHLNGTTFQCFYPSGNGFHVLKSTIGKIRVIGQSVDFESSLLQLLITQFQSNIYFDLDHNKLYFNNTNKTFAWKSESDTISQDCDSYQMSAQSGCDKGCLCGNPVIERWPIINETSITIGEDQIFDDDGQLVVFNIDAYDSHQPERICTSKNLVSKFYVNENVVTNEEAISAFENVSIPLFDITDPVSLFIAIPSLNTEDLDCYCKIQSDNSNGNSACIQFTDGPGPGCNCINDTAFSHSASQLKICNISTAEKCHLYLIITNVTTELNNTKLHFYQGFRSCPGSCQNRKCSHRRYVQALKLSEVLPEPPDVNISVADNYTICFHSQHVEGILIDSYEVTIVDVTKEVLYLENHTIVDDNLTCSIPGNELFDRHGGVCAPFIVTVKAINHYGSSQTDKTVNLQTQGSNECLCLEETVKFSLLTVMKNATSITLRVQQSSEYYVFGINYQLRFCLNINGSDEEFCPNISSTGNMDLEETFDDLNCTQNYNAYVIWISANVTECFLTEARDIRLDCQVDPDVPEMDYTLIIIVTSVGGIIVILVIVAIIIVGVIGGLRFKRRGREQIMRFGGRSSISDDRRSTLSSSYQYGTVTTESTI